MAKLKNKISYLLALVIPVFSVSAVADEPKAAGSDEEAAK
jgi:hypothetical protein